ncbi:MAG: hypothetical protein ACREF3_08905, partial [Acetobacteraceae bacterium]
YSTYEMACNAVKMFIDGETLHAVPYGGAGEREAALLANTGTLDQGDAAELTEAIIRAPEPAYIEVLSKLLLAGKSPRHILDTIQIAAATVVIETQRDTGFSMPHHCYEYCSTLGWYYDNFDHKMRLKLLYVAASFLNRAAAHQRDSGDANHALMAAPRGSDRLLADRILDRVEDAIMALNGPESLAWTQAYLDNSGDRALLVGRIALAACRMGNDPHNQEIAQCMLEDFGKNRSPDKDRLLLAAAYHTAMHRKYGDARESSRRFGEAMGISGLS